MWWNMSACDCGMWWNVSACDCGMWWNVSCVIVYGQLVQLTWHWSENIGTVGQVVGGIELYSVVLKHCPSRKYCKITQYRIIE